VSGSSVDVQQLARVVLNVLDPLIQAGTALSFPTENSAPGMCQQVWCPVCAVAAISAGEQHSLTSVLAEHGAALLAVIRSVADPDPADTDVSPPADEPAHAPNSYQPIPVTIHE
jgi:hypothetical protein